MKKSRRRSTSLRPNGRNLQASRQMKSQRGQFLSDDKLSTIAGGAQNPSSLRWQASLRAPTGATPNRASSQTARSRGKTPSTLRPPVLPSGPRPQAGQRRPAAAAPVGAVRAPRSRVDPRPKARPTQIPAPASGPRRSNPAPSGASRAQPRAIDYRRVHQQGGLPTGALQPNRLAMQALPVVNHLRRMQGRGPSRLGVSGAYP